MPQSQEVPSALIIGIFLLTCGAMGPTLYQTFVTQIREGLTFKYGGSMDSSSFARLLQTCGMTCLMAIMPFLLVGLAASVFSSIVSSGWSLSTKAISVKFERISPIKGFKNLFSLKSLAKLLASFVKLAVIIIIVYAYLSEHFDEIMALCWSSPEGSLICTCKMLFGLLGRITIGLIVIAGADLLYQKWQYKRDLRMTKQEVKEERKQYEASPLIKSRIRSIQIEMTRKRMLRKVPAADVVIVNPTHVAVALKYTPGEMDAPILVAKGPDLLCEKIKEIAREHNIPIVQRPELARTIYNSVEPGGVIPETLYVAVAEVLAMIYRLRRKRLGIAAGN